ncbi:MAG TPA: ATP-binding protein [Terriglobales bacterium]|nr:ATP-binding protein [Terriglobales bacterium]
MKRRLSIRQRLTLWYAALLAAALILFTLSAIYLMRRSIYITVDEQLADEMTAVQNLIENAGPSTLPEQVRAHAELQAGSSLLQVSDENGNFLYRSPRLQKLGVPTQMRKRGKFVIVWFGRTPLRLYSAVVDNEGRRLTVQVAQDMDDYFDATSRYELLLLIGIPVLLIAAAAGGFWLSGRALTPVDEITRAAQNINPSDLSSRVVVPETHDELQRLAQTLNAMLQRIEGAFRRMTQFTADASHELRTPIALIRTRAEVTLRKSRDDQEYRDSLQEILEESERISALIENLMLLARADIGTEALLFKQVNICDIAHRASAQGKMLAEARQLSWSDTIPDAPLWVTADSDSLGRLLLILIDNAVKYTPGYGSVGIHVSQLNGHACVEVRDTGIGIAETDLPHVFERFYRADSARSRDSGGAGLGLSIGQWIARAHRGEITVQSIVESGSSFQLKLPLAN